MKKTERNVNICFQSIVLLYTPKTPPMSLQRAASNPTKGGSNHDDAQDKNVLWPTRGIRFRNVVPYQLDTAHQYGANKLCNCPSPGTKLRGRIEHGCTMNKSHAVERYRITTGSTTMH